MKEGWRSTNRKYGRKKIESMRKEGSREELKEERKKWLPTVTVYIMQTLSLRRWRSAVYLLQADQSERLSRQRRLDWNRRDGLDEHQASRLQAQRGAGALWRLGGPEGTAWAGDQTQVLQREVQDGRAGTADPTGLMWRGEGGGSQGFAQAKVGRGHFKGGGRSGAWGQKNDTEQINDNSSIPIPIWISLTGSRWVRKWFKIPTTLYLIIIKR